MKAINLPLAACMLALSWAACGAEESKPTKTVFYGDLNLSSQAGQQELTSRVRNAINSLCDGVQLTEPLATWQARRKCGAEGQRQAQLQLSAAIAAAQRGESRIALDSQDPNRDR